MHEQNQTHEQAKGLISRAELSELDLEQVTGGKSPSGGQSSHRCPPGTYYDPVQQLCKRY
jgi:hypothetical protein